MSCPELLLIKVTKDENIFYCPSVLGQARYAADSSTKAGLDPVSPADQNCMLVVVFFCH